MDRRSFLRGVLGLSAAAAVVAILPTEAQAAMPVSPLPNAGEAERAVADFRPDVDGAAAPENAQYYYYRRPRRRFYGRRRVYRRRRVIYRRRRFARRRYYW